MTKWKSVGQTSNYGNRLRLIRAVLTGIIILSLTLCCLSLSGCTTNKEYVEIEREPITCINSMKTPEDILLCLNEYATRY